MADESQAIRGIYWREAFPFTHLFRAFRIAVHPSKLVLGLLLILTLYIGGRVLDAIWPTSALPNAFEVQDYEGFRWEHPENATFAPEAVRNAILWSGASATAAQRFDFPEALRRNPAMALEKRGVFDEFFQYEADQVQQVLDSVLANRWLGGIAETRQPAPSVVRGLTNLLVIGPGWLVREHPVYAILFGIVFLVAWAVFGGAIARIAAVHVARDEKISLRQAVGFSFSKILSFVFAPLIPLIIILAAGIAVAVGGLLFYIPWIGPIIAACFLILALIAGFVMTLVATGMVGGLNLMYPTIAVEGSDSFDAISRSFSYVFARPWRMLLYTIVSLIYGALCYLFVRWFIYVMLGLTHYFVAWWLRGQPQAYFPMMWPQPDIQALGPSPAWSNLKGTEALAAGIICFWVYLVVSLLGAFLISFYFSANTIIYYLMRQEVDATELDDVYVEETDEEFTEPAAAPASAGAEAAPIATPVSTEVTEAAAAVVTIPVSETVPPPAPMPHSETTSPPAEPLPPMEPPAGG